jgi:ribonuclease BN (tRNA processing enzyme)
VGWGHSHYLFTLKIANEAAVKKVILFHHEQNRTDDRVEEILQTCVKEIKTRNYRFECLAAEEGMVLEW